MATLPVAPWVLVANGTKCCCQQVLGTQGLGREPTSALTRWINSVPRAVTSAGMLENQAAWGTWIVEAEWDPDPYLSVERLAGAMSLGAQPRLDQLLYLYTRG